MPSIQAGIVTMDMQWFVGILLGIIAIGGAGFGFLLKYALGLHKEQALLKAQIFSLEERNSNLKDKIAELKETSFNLQKTVQEKHTDEALFSKYDFNNAGVAIHKNSKKLYCPACLQTSKREVPLPEDHEDNYWRCTVNREHIFEKIGQRSRHGGYANSDWNPIE